MMAAVSKRCSVGCGWESVRHINIPRNIERYRHTNETDRKSHNFWPTVCFATDVED
jgi:hypothetical protein